MNKKTRYIFLKYIFLLCVAFAPFGAKADVTLEECLEAARSNYPLIQQYGLIDATEEINLSDINKGWLPRVGVYAQGSVQNVVPSFPAPLSAMVEQMGSGLRGLGKLQYKAGVDLSQTIWDGGASKARRELTHQRAQVDQASLDVEMYNIRQRVESLYFGILLMQEQIEQTESALAVYQANLERLRSMVANGTAMRSDADMVEAQLLSVKQQLASAKSAEKSYIDMLAIFTGLELADETLLRPSGEIPAELTPNRPELGLFDAQKLLNESRRATIDATVMPKIGFFAQAYYGYPGIDYFRAMMNRDLTFNILAGVKLTWNIDSFYTKKNSLHQIDIDNQAIDIQQRTFLFSNSMQTASQLDAIRGVEEVMADDARIVELRHNVRLAAESQLRNGIIDTNALIAKINDETQANLSAAYHSIQRLQAIYNLKNTLNR